MQKDVNLVVIHFPMFGGFFWLFLRFCFFFFFVAIWYLVNMIHTLTALEKMGIELLIVRKTFFIVSELICSQNQNCLFNIIIDFQ